MNNGKWIMNIELITLWDIGCRYPRYIMIVIHKIEDVKGSNTFEMKL